MKAIKYDKLMHFAVGAGFAKDVVWDLYLKRGTFEVLDIFFTGVGGVIGMAVAIVITNII